MASSCRLSNRSGGCGFFGHLAEKAFAEGSPLQGFDCLGKQGVERTAQFGFEFQDRIGGRLPLLFELGKERARLVGGGN